MFETTSRSEQIFGTQMTIDTLEREVSEKLRGFVKTDLPSPLTVAVHMATMLHRSSVLLGLSKAKFSVEVEGTVVAYQALNRDAVEVITRMRLGTR